MKILESEIPLSAEYESFTDFFNGSPLFFDIETTGFSPKFTNVYLIGCAYCTDSEKLTIRQFFSESREDEPKILQAFFELMKDCSTLVTFNGTGFDIPYLKERCRHLQLSECLDSYASRDIFKALSPLKKVLKLPNMKQKTLEAFLNVERKDLYSGGELINIYQDYLSAPSSEAFALLQLHNYEDVAGLFRLLPALSYAGIFQGDFDLASMETHSYEEYEGSKGLELLFTLRPHHELPRRISYGKQDIYLTGFGSVLRLKVTIYQGELKYFYSNYKDYYYLPEEDYAIHKSVAFYVDKNYRTRAKAATCYGKKTGRFLPQYGELFSPYFKLEYHHKTSYFEMTEEFTACPNRQKEYVMHLLEVLLRD